MCTTEAMPLSREVDFVAVDEVQLATHEERGHVFTERLLNARGRRETWFLGAGTMRSVVATLVPAARQEERPRLSQLTFRGRRKAVTAAPAHGGRRLLAEGALRACGAFARAARRHRAGTRALSPRARNAQVALFQAGEVDTLVATDAIGMGLNLDVEHIAFASLRKFDGRHPRALRPAEVGQIAGRAGRFLRPGTFGSIHPLVLDRELAMNVESHRFEPVHRVRYRNTELDFSSPAALLASLNAPPWHPLLAGVTHAADTRALEALLADEKLVSELKSPLDVERLWQVCQIPDFRSILFEVHLELLRLIWDALSRGPISTDFLREEMLELGQMVGDADVLMARIARLRTWTFAANQAGWVMCATEMQGELAALEDRLSDALHAALVERFVERRAHTSLPCSDKKPRSLPIVALRDDSAFRPFLALESLKERLERDPADRGMKPARHLERLADLPHEAFRLDDAGFIGAEDLRLARLTRGRSLATPEVRLLELPELAAATRLRLERRLHAFTRDWVGRLLSPVRELARSEVPALRAVAYQLEEGLGTALREPLEPSLATLDAAAERVMSNLGIRVGRLSVCALALANRAARASRVTLVATLHGNATASSSRASRGVPTPPCPRGLLPFEAWLALGALPVGPWVLRADLAERAADHIVNGQSPLRVLASLGVPRRERPHVATALESMLEPLR